MIIMSTIITLSCPIQVLALLLFIIITLFLLLGILRHHDFITTYY